MLRSWTGASSDAIEAEKERFLSQRSSSEKDMRSLGKYFQTMESVWGTERVAVQSADFETIMRTQSQGALYESCYVNLDLSIRDGSNSRSSTANHRENSLKLDAFGNVDAEAAHLIPNAVVCSKAYGFLAEAAVGFRVSDDERVLTDKAAAGKRRKILVGVKGKNSTSLKGHRFNKMYCKEQKTYFDTEDPSILFIPCLTLPEVMNWATNQQTATEYDVIALTFTGKAKIAASRILQFAPQECSDTELEDARLLLTTFLKGVAGSLKNNNVEESFADKELENCQNTSLLKWVQLVKEIKENNAFTITVPTALEAVGDVGERLHVAKAMLSLETFLPDPWLLLVKSAINYSAFGGTKLMPACRRNDDDDDDDCTEDTSQGGAEEAWPSDDKEQADFFAHALQRAGLSQQLSGRC